MYYDHPLPLQSPATCLSPHMIRVWKISPLHDTRSLTTPACFAHHGQAGCEYGRIVSDLFPEDGALCFAKVEPEYAEVTPGWRPMPYAKILEAHRGVGAVEGASMSDDQLTRLAASLCKTLGA